MFKAKTVQLKSQRRKYIHSSCPSHQRRSNRFTAEEKREGVGKAAMAVTLVIGA